MSTYKSFASQYQPTPPRVVRLQPWENDKAEQKTNDGTRIYIISSPNWNPDCKVTERTGEKIEWYVWTPKKKQFVMPNKAHNYSYDWFIQPSDGQSDMTKTENFQQEITWYYIQEIANRFGIRDYLNGPFIEAAALSTIPYKPVHAFRNKLRTEVQDAMIFAHVGGKFEFIINPHYIEFSCRLTLRERRIAKRMSAGLTVAPPQGQPDVVYANGKAGRSWDQNIFAEKPADVQLEEEEIPTSAVWMQDHMMFLAAQACRP